MLDLKYVLRLASMVVLTILSACSWIDSDDDDDEAASIAPTAAFSTSLTSGSAPLEITFTDTSQPGSSAITGWSWAFGDGGTSSEQNPSYTYQNEGSYSPTLTVTTAVGSNSVTGPTIEVTPSNEPPTASFTSDISSGRAPLVVTFSDTSADGTSDINTWLWDFGDGNQSSEQNPQHTYANAGQYTVTLTVTSAAGSDSTTSASTIDVEAANIGISLALLQTDGRQIELSDLPQVTSTTFTVESVRFDANNDVIVEIRPDEASGILNLQADGFFESLVYLDSGLAASRQPLTLLPLTPPIQVNALLGGTYTGIDGAKVQFQPETLIDVDGRVPTDPVTLYIQPVNTNDRAERSAFPGSFLGRPLTLAEDIPIYSYGVVNMSLFDTAGRPVQLRDGATAELTLPIYAEQNLDETAVAAGQQIPFWILDEVTGIWEQQSLATVVEEPLAPTGFALAATTTHFSWFNTDAWGVPGSAPGGGTSQWCDLRVLIAGLEMNELYRISLSRATPGLPSSTITRTRAFTGDATTATIPAASGFIAQATKIDTDIADRAGFFCRDGNPVDITLDLSTEDTPEFLEFFATVRPVFEYNSDTELFEINRNRVTTSALFIKAENMLLNAPFMETPVELPTYLPFDEDLFPSDISPQIITATLTNDLGSVTEEAEIEYIEESSPLVDRVQAFTDPDGIAQFSWDVEGADTVAIYLLGPTFDPTNLGILFTDTDPNNVPTPELGFSTGGLRDYDGYVRIEFRNQYGATDIYGTLFGTQFCLPDSDLPCAAF